MLKRTESLAYSFTCLVGWQSFTWVSFCLYTFQTMFLHYLHASSPGLAGHTVGAPALHDCVVMRVSQPSGSVPGRRLALQKWLQTLSTYVSLNQLCPQLEVPLSRPPGGPGPHQSHAIPEKVCRQSGRKVLNRLQLNIILLQSTRKHMTTWRCC